MYSVVNGTDGWLVRYEKNGRTICQCARLSDAIVIARALLRAEKI